MQDQWQSIREVSEREPNLIEAGVYVPPESLWFSGHFPGEPIMPGIALLNIAWQVIVRAGGRKGDQIRLDALKRIRFTQPVRPGETLTVVIAVGEADGKNLYSFKIISKENIICSGVIAGQNINEGGE